jgi:histidinol-phosphate aminotransferase
LLIGAKDTVSELDKLRLPYNINTLTQVSANFLLQEKEEIDKNAKAILTERSSLSAALSAIDGLTVYPSQANFILFRAPGANALFEALKAQGVLIKNLSAAPGLTDCLRVTVGSAEENSQFIEIVKNHYG